MVVNNKNNSITKDDYDIVKELGRGAYAAVYKIKFNNNSEDDEKAIKVLKSSNGIANPIELHIMSALRHPNIMEINKIVSQPRRKIGLIMPLATHTLRYVLDNLSLKAKTKIMLDITSGLDFLHRQGILHLDIKDDNVLLYGTLEHPIARLNDFGLSLMSVNDQPVESSLLRITYIFRPPEIKKTDKIHLYSKENDIWSLGILFMSILHGNYPFKYEVPYKCGNDRELRVIPENEFIRLLYQQLSCSKKSQIFKRYSNPFYSKIIERMMDFDKNKRPTTMEIMQYIDKNKSENTDYGEVLYPSIEKFNYEPYHQLHVNMVEKILITMKVDISILFLYHDLCFRSIPCLKMKKKPKGPNKTLRTFYTACAWLSIKFYTNDFYSAHKIANIFDIPIVKLINSEIKILQYLEGVIYRPYLFDTCRCLEDCVQCYSLCKSDKYNKINITDIKNKIKSVKEDIKIESDVFISKYVKK